MNPPTTHDETAAPARWRSAIGRPSGPASLAAVALGGCVLVNVVDPNEPGALGICPFKLITGGLDCPGCGVLRATRALTRGNVVAALDHNALAVLVLPLLLAMLLTAWRAAHRGTGRGWSPSPRLATGIAVAVPVFWLVRNLPAGAWLASGLA